jgi:hypothetical protein
VSVFEADRHPGFAPEAPIVAGLPNSFTDQPSFTPTPGLECREACDFDREVGPDHRDSTLKVG